MSLFALYVFLFIIIFTIAFFCIIMLINYINYKICSYREDSYDAIDEVISSMNSYQKKEKEKE
jgi:CHASE3 domain sensor protein